MQSHARGRIRRLVLLAPLWMTAALMPLWLLQNFPVEPHPEGRVELVPLAVREAREPSTTRFVERSAEQTGIDFQNELAHHNTHTYLTNGAGLAVGDYDQDGLPDLYFVSQDGGNRLYRQIAPLRFEDATEQAGDLSGGEAWGSGACFVDVDGDGWLDLYVCNMEAKNLLYRNRGDGTFEECAARFGLDIAAASTMAAFCDYDRDGDLDVYLLTNRALHATLAMTEEVLRDIKAPADSVRPARQMVPSLQQLDAPALRRLQQGEGQPGDAVPNELREHFLVAYDRLWMAGQPDRLLQNDQGTFREVTSSAGLQGAGVDQGMGLSATWWDHDDDGWPDLYVANDLESPDVLWRNMGDGTFQDITLQTLPHTAYYGMGSDAGDIDNDGRLDFFVADMSATTHKKAKILMGDMNAQRAALIHSRPQQQMRNSLFWNAGTGRFAEVARIAGVASTDWTWSTLFGDLDNDGLLDLFVTNGIARFEMNPDLGIRVSRLWRDGRQQEAIDLIRNVPPLPERNVALRNESNLAGRSLHFEKNPQSPRPWGLDQQGISHGAALVDLDRDGDLDVVTNNWNATASVFENTSDQDRNHAFCVELRGRSNNRTGLGARVWLRQGDRTQVREAWSSRGYLSGQEARLHYGLGERNDPVTVLVRWPSGRLQEVRDLPVDHLAILHEPAAGAAWMPASPDTQPLFAPLAAAPDARQRETDFDDYDRQFLLPHKMSQLGSGVAAGDADGDGRDELFLGSGKGHAGTLMSFQRGRWREVEGPWREDLECEDMAALWLDADGDSDLDLLVTSGGVEVPAGDERLRDRLYLNLGNLVFRRDYDALPDVRESSGAAAAADFDGDGDLDLFVAGRTVPDRYPEAPPSRLLRNDAGRFRDVTTDCAPALMEAGMVTAALFLPLGSDPYPDLVLAGRWQPLRIFENTDGTSFRETSKERGLPAEHGWWNSLAALDVDNDGDLDLVAGNQGTNTKYKASAEHPLGLVYSDFDDNGTRDLVETKYEGDRLLPVRGRSCSSQAMPFLAERFPTYEQFASSLLEDIYPSDKLAGAKRLSAQLMQSVVLRRQDEGTFQLQPLDQMAQWAPIQGMAVADFDGDGRTDVACGTNFFSPEPESGHFDGGLGLLLHGGEGGLGSLQPAVSGISHCGDHKGACATDLDADGCPDLVLAQNSGPLVCLRGRPAEKPLQLRLQGPAGNPTAVGAVVTVERADGSRQAMARLAGSGYLSQDSAALWIGRSGAALVAVEVVWPSGQRTRHTDGLALEVWDLPSPR